MSKNTRRGHRRITRRLFLTFVGFVLLPVVLLSGVALQYVAQNTAQQVQQLLDAEVDSFANQTLSRIEAIGLRLDLYARDMATGSSEQLSFVRVQPEFLSAADSATEVTTDPAAKADHLRRGEPALTMKRNPQGKLEAYLLKADWTDAAGPGLLALRLEENQILGTPDTRNLNFDNCIFSKAGDLLFATNHGLCTSLAGPADKHRSSGRHRFNGVDYYATYRSLFLKALFAADDWQFAVATRDVSLLEASDSFRNTFIAVALLALLALSLLSIRLIGRQMSPLDALMAGIERVTKQNYDETVAVDSGDEFETMADAFNNMSRRVSNQLQTLGSMSEIDQLILARGKKEDILGIVLEKTRLLIAGDQFALLLPDSESSSEAHIYTLKQSDDRALQQTPVTLTDADQTLLRSAGSHIFSHDDPTRPGFISVLDDKAIVNHQVIPVSMEDRLVAVLFIGASTAQQPDEEARELASRYADRIAVALSNAEWEEKLYQQANYDALTSLPNRPALIDELRRRISRAERENLSFGVTFVDLDNFKIINDSLGHDTGDRFIKAVGERLTSVLRKNDLVARLGGDEFIVLSSENHSYAQTVSSMNGIANRTLDAVQAPIHIDGSEIRATASLGIAIYPRDGKDAATLMKSADMAMYHAKSEGPGRFKFFSEELNSEAMELLQLSTDLKTALERDEFLLHFQPKVNGQTHEIIGAEALIRWQHPERGLLFPGAFIEAAETLGLINAIGDRALSAACRHLEKWKQAGVSTVPISVNIAASQIQQEDLVSRVRELIQQHALSGKDLELEITERVLVKQVDETIAKLRAIRALGVSVSIDDYGTGYSSLSYMKHLPANKLKIDGSFIADLPTDAADQAIVSSAILLARRLDMETIAEGVENLEQLALLNAYGCDEIQGFLFSKGVPEDEFAAMLSSSSSTSQRASLNPVPYHQP